MTNRRNRFGLTANDTLKAALDKVGAVMAGLPFSTTVEQPARSAVMQACLHTLADHLDTITQDEAEGYLDTHHTRTSTDAPGTEWVYLDDTSLQRLDAIGDHLAAQDWHLPYLERGEVYNRPMIIAVAVGWTADHLDTILNQWIQEHAS